jgi:hypothetical protein
MGMGFANATPDLYDVFPEASLLLSNSSLSSKNLFHL